MRILTAVFLALAAASAFAQIDPNKPVMSINGNNINEGEYYRRMEFLPNTARVLDSGALVRLSPGMLTIIQLVDDYVLIQLAKDKGVMPTDQEIDDTIKQQVQANPDFKTEWINSGRTEDELRSAVKMNLIEFKLQTQGITVSDQQVTDFYHNHQLPGLTVAPRTVQLRLIAVKDDAAEKTVDDNLSAGHSFEDVAKSDSLDATSENGGELGTVVTDDLPKEVVGAIDSTKINSTTPWVDETVGKDSNNNPIVYHVKYLIEGKTAQAPLPFTDALKEAIRRKMMLDQSQGKNNVAQELADERKKAQIVIDSPLYAKEYEQIMKQYFHEDVNVSAK